MAQNLTEAEIAEFRELFELMDKDKGGSLSTDELKQLMDMLGMKVRPDELDAIIVEIDADGSGFVDFEEFVQVMARPVELPYKRQDVMRAFAMFAEPTDQQGQINPENLERTLVKYCGDKIGVDEIGRLIAGLDLTADGQFDYENKVNMFVT